MSGPLQTTFDQYPKCTDSTNYMSTTRRFERRQLTAGHFVQIETLAAPIYQLLTFHCRADVVFFPSEIVMVSPTCYRRHFIRRALALINHDLVVI